MYEVIYADPPWQYRHVRTKSRAIENQYPTMNLADICAINVPRAEDAVLYMWATAPKLDEAMAVMRAWRFDYRTCMVWDKEIIGMGYWFRGQHELLLVGVNGKFKPPEQSLRISSVYKERRGKHSKKPDAIRDYISSWYPDKRKIELFAREKTPGWDVWGNEVENTVHI